MSKLSSFLFQKIHSGNLVYNTCWEDPRCDRMLLNLNEQSRIVMITSAGDNALEYLLDDVAKIDCIDLNYRQNALLALKIACFRHGDFSLLWKLFGEGKYINAKEAYTVHLRKHLPKYAEHFWDQHISYFNETGIRNSFYYHGTSGAIAFLMKGLLAAKPRLRKLIKALFEAESIQQQEKSLKNQRLKWWKAFSLGRYVLTSCNIWSAYQNRRQI